MTATAQGPESAWIRSARATVSQRTVLALVALTSLSALALVAWLALVPRTAREHGVLELATQILESCPPTDEVIRQLPPERRASVQARGMALVVRMLQPAVWLAILLLGAATAGYALLARKLRRSLAALSMPRGPSVAALFQPWPVFGTLALLAALAHIPHALTSLRYDEDAAALLATDGWLCWANNVSSWGWGVHVAASLSIRLSTALLGTSELSVRAPAIVASSLGLALLCTQLYRSLSPRVGWLTALMLVALPMWAEQTSLARGYGLSFAGAALLAVALVRLYGEGDAPTSPTLACLWCGVLVSALAHVFCVFLVAGVFVSLWLSGDRLSLGTRTHLSWWIALASLLPALSFLSGAPASLAITQGAAGAGPGLGVALERTIYELGFRHPGSLGWALAIVVALVSTLAVISLPRGLHLRALAILLISFTPIALNPVYLYPRYFLHLLPLWTPVVAWFLSERVLRARPRALAALGLSVALLWLSTRPWDLPVFVDLRGAAQIARAEHARLGPRFAIDTFISNGVRFYNGNATRVLNTSYPIPADVERLLVPKPHDAAEARLPQGFELLRQLPGTEHEVLLLARKP